MPDAQAMETLEELLRGSVKSQLLSDVKVGCQLSGGIDSSVVSVFARSHFDANMETFSIVFDDPRYTEQPWMEEAAAAARAVSHQFTFTSDFFFDTIAKASWHMDQPMGHPNSVGIWLLAERAHEYVTVLLSGEGADEVFGGYTRFYYASLQQRVSPWLPSCARIPESAAASIASFAAPPPTVSSWGRCFTSPKVFAGSGRTAISARCSTGARPSSPREVRIT
jgi:asparagine synthase (glutamine-hydrolysing)